MAPIPRDLVTVDSAAAYDRFAPGYDRLLVENRINAYMRRAMRSIQLAAFHPGDRLIEIGCGTGDEAMQLATNGCEVVGIDPSIEMIRTARKKVDDRALSGRISFHVGYARDLDRVLSAEGPGTFDGAFSSFALSYEADLEPVRRALARLVRPGGTMVVSTMNRVSAVEIPLAMLSLHPSLAGRRLGPTTMHKVGSVQTAVHCRSPAELARAFRPEFSLVRIRGLPVLLPPHYANRPLKRWPFVLESLAKLDAVASPLPVLRDLGDHTVAWFRRSD